MPITLNHLKNDVRTTTVRYAGESSSITFRPSVITANRNASRRQAIEEDDPEWGIKFLCELLVSWEVMGEPTAAENGEIVPAQPLPITPEVLRDLPDPLLTAIMNACQEEMYPKLKNGRR